MWYLRTSENLTFWQGRAVVKCHGRKMAPDLRYVENLQAELINKLLLHTHMYVQYMQVLRSS